MTAVATGSEARVTHRTLQAAWHVSRRAAAEGCSESTLIEQLPGIATGGIHDRESLKRGMLLLIDVGLFDRVGRKLAPTAELLALRQMPLDTFVEVLLMRSLTVNPDLWLTLIGSGNVLPWEFVPSDVQDALSSTFASAEERGAFLLNAASKVDQDAMAAIGAIGEETVVTACQDHLRNKGRPDLTDGVVRVSLADDTLGFDVVSPDVQGRRHRLEVKATGAPPGWVEFFLSRNEATVGARTADWAVVVCKRQINDDEALEMQVIGWVRYEAFAHLLPTDTVAAGPGESGKWASCRIKLTENALVPGLPLDH